VNPGPHCAPTTSSKTKKRITKKLTLTILSGLAVLFARLTTAGDVTSAPYEDNVASSVRPGLSRQRPAFRKALSMLAEAAQANQNLADYYERVTSRVKGAAADSEFDADAGAVTSVRRSNPGLPGADNIKRTTASDAVSQAEHQALIAVVQAATAESVSQSDTETSQGKNESNPQPQLTVGDIAFDTNPAIEQWMNYYGATTVGRSTLKIGIDRSNEYLEMARAEFRGAGVPEDLVWLAFVESVWNPRAVSPAAAGGMWQFIPATATEYGLKVQSGNDERADPLKQTRAAAAYLRDLYTIFGGWELAMAAYNAGEPGVMSAIIRNGNADFWEMYDKQLLPRETCNYIPKILAAIKIASKVEIYGRSPQLETPVPSAG